MFKWDSFVIILGCLIINYLTFGMVTSFGLMYSEIIDYFCTGKGETTWIPSLAFGILLVVGPVASLIERRSGAPTLTALGGITMATGMVSSVFVPNMYLLYLTYGIISGSGFGLSVFAAQVTATLHSDKRRAIDVAVASTGSGLGRMTLPALTRFFLRQYGWRGTFLILAGFSLQAVIVAFLFRLISKSKNGEKKIDSNKVQQGNKLNFLNFVNTAKFCLFSSTVLVYCLAYLVPFVILPSFAHEKGVSKEDGDWLITVSGISGITGRISIGLLANQKHVNNLYLYGCILLLDGCLSTGCAFIDIYPLFVVYAVFLGIFTGSYAVLMPVAAVDVVGKENLSIALGIVNLFAGIAMSIGPPIAGWISDATGRYDEAFYYRGALFVLGGILCLCIPKVIKNKQYITVPTVEGNTVLFVQEDMLESRTVENNKTLCGREDMLELRTVENNQMLCVREDMLELRTVENNKMLCVREDMLESPTVENNQTLCVREDMLESRTVENNKTLCVREDMLESWTVENDKMLCGREDMLESRTVENNKTLCVREDMLEARTVENDKMLCVREDLLELRTVENNIMLCGRENMEELQSLLYTYRIKNKIMKYNQ